MAESEARSNHNKGDILQRKRHRYKSDSEHVLKKRLPPRLPRRNNDVYITNKSNYQGQLSRCEKLLNDGESEIVIHGLGAAVPRAVNLALHLKSKHLGTIEVAVNTSTVDIVANHRITQGHLSIQCGISRKHVKVIIAELGFWKIWVPRMLLPHMKQKRMGICQLVLHYEQEGDEFLKNIVTGDGNWVHHFNPENKRSSLQFHHKGSHAPKKFKAVPSAGKLMLTVFWNIQGVVHMEFMPESTTINSVSAMTTEHILHLGFAVVDHPPYSPNMAPSDFHLFPKLKEYLREHLFDSDDAVQTEVRLWFRHQNETFYSDSIKKLVTHWEKCIHHQGDYVKK
ncbi:hypothetical protein ANN_04289 [Periplaneta americana]|uniref:DNA/RNA-binding protein Alba-like domain-containing protein n=1 Tax=Periplaneta americana TaxID=6978 RepID=A0ABQ8TA26_PERAM|nr:hypothetical protein ANN_04289 [Periplaneta americana]